MGGFVRGVLMFWWISGLEKGERVVHFVHVHGNLSPKIAVVDYVVDGHVCSLAHLY